MQKNWNFYLYLVIANAKNTQRSMAKIHDDTKEVSADSCKRQSVRRQWRDRWQGFQVDDDTKEIDDNTEEIDDDTKD